jgi:hypothetical protein
MSEPQKEFLYKPKAPQGWNAGQQQQTYGEFNSKPFIKKYGNTMHLSTDKQVNISS